MRFHVNVGNMDGLTRGLGGVPLLIASVLALPGVGGQTVETLALWLALSVGLLALLAAFGGHCSWFAGVIISATTWVLLVLRHVPSVTVQAAAAAIGIAVALYALYTRSTKKCPVNYFFKITQPHREYR